MPVEFLLNVNRFGGGRIVSSYVYYSEEEDEFNKHLRTVIREEVCAAKNGIAFTATDEEIIDVIGTGGANIRKMLDRPLKVFPPRFKEVNVKILCSSTSADAKKDDEVVDLVEENKVVMTFLNAKYSMDHVHDFIHRFQNRPGGRQSFLESNRDTPTYEDQIDTTIKHIMEHPKNGMRPCGYLERQGAKIFREKQLREAEKAANNLEVDEVDEPTKEPAKIEICLEFSRLQSAVRRARSCFIFVHDHRQTLQSRDASLFNTPILNAIKDVDPGGTRMKQKRKTTHVTQRDIKLKIGDVSRALSDLPSWCTEKIEKHGTVRKGEVLVHELENLRSILRKCQSALNSQAGHKFFAKHRETGTTPNHTNTDVDVIKRAPSRPDKSKRSEHQRVIYSKADEIMRQLQNGEFYKTFSVTDAAMSIDGPEWDGGQDGRTRRAIRSKIINQLGSDKFW